MLTTQSWIPNLRNTTLPAAVREVADGLRDRLLAAPAVKEVAHAGS